jgi:hypothetical protein
MSEIEAAKHFAGRARLPEDIVRPTGPATISEAKTNLADHMLRHGLLISEELTPDLDNWLRDVCISLSLPRQHVTAFAYNDSSVKADCFIESSNSCLLRFSSGLINLMGEEEFKFVAGHEIGHFLLEHGLFSESHSVENAESFLIQRAGELSADRLGYLAAKSIDCSLRAIIKTASGLDDSFLRFDVGAFQRQLNLISKPGAGESQSSTHPSMLMRCRALLWFSMSVGSRLDLESASKDEMSVVNTKVEKDLHRLVDGHVRQKKELIEKDIALWKAMLLIFHDGAFSQNLQKKFESFFGIESLNQARGFFDLYGSDELEEQIEKRLSGALKSAETEFPVSYKTIENSAFSRAYTTTKPN